MKILTCERLVGEEATDRLFGGIKLLSSLIESLALMCFRGEDGSKKSDEVPFETRKLL